MRPVPHATVRSARLLRLAGFTVGEAARQGYVARRDCHVDVMRLPPRINAGILSAWRSGILTSATMLMTTPWLEQTVRDAVRGAGLPVGIHLALTVGKSVAGHREVPDLTDESGDLTATAARLFSSVSSAGPGRASSSMTFSPPWATGTWIVAF